MCYTVNRKMDAKKEPGTALFLLEKEENGMNTLTLRQEKFCREYLVDLNATQAAIRAGYSEKTAAYQASRLLRNVKVLEYIKKLRGEREKRVQVTQDEVIRELAAIALLPLESNEILSNLVKVSDKLKSLELLGKHFGLFVDKVEQKTELTDGINVNIKVME